MAGGAARVRFAGDRSTLANLAGGLLGRLVELDRLATGKARSGSPGVAVEPSEPELSAGPLF